MSVDGGYTQDAGTTLFEIDGSSQSEYDELKVSGDVRLSGGTIDIMFADGFIPKLGETFDLISADALATTGISVDISGLPTSYEFKDEFTSTGLDLDTDAIPGGSSGTVPEPSPAYLLALGFALLLAAMRRRRPWSYRWGSSRLDTMKPAQ
jgi:hypothetical protein